MTNLQFYVLCAPINASNICDLWDQKSVYSKCQSWRFERQLKFNAGIVKELFDQSQRIWTNKLRKQKIIQPFFDYFCIDFCLTFKASSLTFGIEILLIPNVTYKHFIYYFIIILIQKVWDPSIKHIYIYIIVCNNFFLNLT